MDELGHQLDQKQVQVDVTFHIRIKNENGIGLFSVFVLSK